MNQESQKAQPIMFKNVLLVECRDIPGLVHGITGVLFKHQMNITVNQEFVESDQFFMRTEFEGPPAGTPLITELEAILPKGAIIRLGEQRQKTIVIMVSNESHCLGDILIRHEFKQLPVQILGVISNHTSLQNLVHRFDLPFHYVSHEKLTREEHEAKILTLAESIAPDYIVLAKYMRVLTPAFVNRFKGKMINIHHSFLPAFIGAKPYQQAFNRGVKVIGATAHFVTEQLDDGPIIVQQVINVNHTANAQTMAQSGKDVEQIVLSKALKLLCEDRIFLAGNRTIVFD